MDNFGISSATRSSLFAIQIMQGQMTELQQRIATGKRVNDPSDDPGALLFGGGPESRATCFDGLISGISKWQNAINAANKGIVAIQSLVS